MTDMVRTMDIVYLDLSHAFYTVPHKIHTQMMNYGLNENANWLDFWAQRVMISATKSNWRPIMSNVPQESILRTDLLNVVIIISVMGQGVSSASYLMIENFEGHDANQRDLNRLEKWTDMQFNNSCSSTKVNGKSCMPPHAARSASTCCSTWKAALQK